MGDGTHLNRDAILDLLANDQRYRETVADYVLAHRTCATPVAVHEQEVRADEVDCDCGYGGFHEPENPRCSRNIAAARTPGVSGDGSPDSHESAGGRG